jgi:FtsP/CotA-like multicopper oxidase with cupredoxin domain
MRHMAGLILGIEVGPRKGTHAERRVDARAMRLLVQEAPKRTRAPRALAFVLQQGAEPARDSVVLPGTTLVLTRGQPTDITVVNHLAEPTAVHWHGIELESFSDGVAGWSGDKTRMARVIAPNDSFTARLTLRRAGTFIYHTHLNDVEQLTSGLYGGIVVLEPGQVFNAERDHLFVVGWDGEKDPPHLHVNGDSAPPPLELHAGVHHRLRFVFIGAVDGETFTLRRDSSTMSWRQLARDGYTIPAAQRRRAPAVIQGWAGQTFDFDIVPTAGRYTLTVGDPKNPDWQQTIIAR